MNKMKPSHYKEEYFYEPGDCTQVNAVQEKSFDILAEMSHEEKRELRSGIALSTGSFFVQQPQVK